MSAINYIIIIFSKIILNHFFQKIILLFKSIKILKNWYMYPLVYFSLIKKEIVIFETRNGIKIKLRSNSTDFMAFTHVWLIKEYHNENFTIKNNDVVIDIGAHIGLFSLYASNYCLDGKILSFEPVKENFSLLKQNINLNNKKNISFFNCAVSSKNELVKVFLDDDDSGHTLFSSGTNFEKVQSKSLEKIFIENGIEHCDLLKLDCEGAEYEIFETLPHELFSKIQKIVIEYHFADTQPELLKKLIEQLKFYSYSISIKPLFSNIGFLYAQKIDNH